MPANSSLLGQHASVQAILALNCILADCTCLQSSSVKFQMNKQQCDSRFNSHVQVNYTKMNSCKQALKPTWPNASGSLLSTKNKPTCPASDPTARCYPWLATTLLLDVSQIVSSPAVKSPLNFMQSKSNNLDRRPLKWLALWCLYTCGGRPKLLQIYNLKLLSDAPCVHFTWCK